MSADEDRLSRWARRHRLKLVKARPQKSGDRRFMLVDPRTREVVACSDPLNGYGLTLDDVAAALDELERNRSLGSP